MKTLLLLLLLPSLSFAECHCYDIQGGIKNDCIYGGCLQCTGNFACCTATGQDSADGTSCASLGLTALYDCAATSGNCYSNNSSSSSSSSSSSESTCTTRQCINDANCGGLGAGIRCCGGCCGTCCDH